jgi:predicted DNA-binding transcriptional regulator AlpA
MAKDKGTHYHNKPALALLGVSTRSIDRWIEIGRFPRPDLRLPNGRPLWLNETIEAHERSLVPHAA